jgi:hypothetical protein
LSGTLLRYFLITSRPESLLPGGIIEATRSAGLILFTRSFTGLGSGCLGAAVNAIAVPTITARADNDLGMATSTLIKATGCMHRQKSRWGLDLSPKCVTLYGSCICTAVPGGMASTSTVKSLLASYLPQRLFLYCTEIKSTSDDSRSIGFKKGAHLKRRNH